MEVTIHVGGTVHAHSQSMFHCYANLFINQAMCTVLVYKRVSIRHQASGMVYQASGIAMYQASGIVMYQASGFRDSHVSGIRNNECRPSVIKMILQIQRESSVQRMQSIVPVAVYYTR